MNKEEIKALLAIIHRQSFAGVTREAVENNLEYRLLCSAATKLERMLLDIESGYNKLVEAEYRRRQGMSKYVIVRDKENAAWCVCIDGCGADAAFYYDWASGTYTEAQAKVRAEAECDRLNAEHRKDKNENT